MEQELDKLTKQLSGTSSNEALKIDTGMDEDTNEMHGTPAQTNNYSNKGQTEYVIQYKTDYTKALKAEPSRTKPKLLPMSTLAALKPTVGRQQPTATT